MKKIYRFFLAISFLCVFSQIKAQEYERVWGTYFGPAGTNAQGIISPKEILSDSGSNLYINTLLYNSSSTPNSYYDQFFLGSGSPYIIQPGNYGTNLAISSTGNPLSFGYTFFTATANAVTEILVGIDDQDNKIYFYGVDTSSPMSPTVGTWLQNNVFSNVKNLLVKKSPAGSVIWSTYLPGNNYNLILDMDQSGNIYVSGETSLQNLSTSGVFQENFDIIYSQNSIVDNPYIAKLNSSGQLVWASYLPSKAVNMTVYDNSLYLITGKNINTTVNTMATPGAYQTSVASVSITKMNASNGQRIWGTYFGPTVEPYFYLTFDLEADENGVYFTGTDFNLNGSNFFATPGAFKTQAAGTSDLFLTKFTHSGNMVWSTYFGGNGYDLNTFDKVISLHEGEVFISGTTEGSTDNIATPGSYQPMPENMNANTVNQFFAKFDASGNRVWSSYYGGSSVTTPYFKAINISHVGSSLYLFGSTNSNTGYTTENAFMPSRVPNTGNNINHFFFARFDKKEILSASDINLSKDMILYDNPNIGIFTIAGSILKKQNLTFTLLDASGRQLAKEKLSNADKQRFDFSGQLSAGSYLISITDGKGKTVKTFKMTVNK